MKFKYRLKISSLITNFRIIKIVKFFLRKNVKLIFFLKKNFYFTLPGMLSENLFYLYLKFDNDVGKQFFLFPINGKIIAFATGPLNDKRGIGRVTRNLFGHIGELINFKKEFGSLSLSKKKKFKSYDLTCVDVYFFSSIHWCKSPIPNNSVVMIMDVIPLVLKNFFPTVVVTNWEKNLKAIANKCKHVVTISNSSALDIINLLDVEDKKISVINPGLEKIEVNEHAAVEIPHEPFVLFLGSNDFHKNAEVVIRALTTSSLKNTKAVFIGDNKELKSACANFRIIDRVVFLGKLRDSEIGFVISKASVLVFPSLYEGFGLPPLEAAMLETPSVCSRKPAMTEILANSALFADPYDFVEWSEQIHKLINDTALREKIIKKAKARADEFSWKESSKKLLDLLSSV